MKSTATCTIYFEDGTEQTFVNVTHSRWEGDNVFFVVQHYDPADDTRLQTWVFKREHVRKTVRGEADTPATNLSERRKPQAAPTENE
jgi:hypothetical protein